MGERVLITGASGLIGRALVDRHLAAGNFVIAQVRNESLLSSQKNLEVKVFDFATGSGADLIGQIKNVDLIINNAANQEVLSIENVTRSKFEEVLRINVIAPFELSIAGKTAGATRIINISSVEAKVAKSGHEIYGASKAALDSLTKTLANALAPIRVNGVRLGLVGDSELSTRWPTGVSNWRNAVAARRYASPAEVADFVFQIGGKDFSYATGAIFDFDGGKGASAGW